MALTATMYAITLEIADVGRAVYETVELRVARQPSETPEYMLTRVLAYALEYVDGIEMTEGVAAGDQPAVIVRDLTGRVTAWIEVGMPHASRLHRGSKLAGRVAVYTHRSVSQWLSQLSMERIHRREDIPIYAFERGFVDEVAAHLERRCRLSLSTTERELYATLGDRSFQTTIVEHRIGEGES